MSDDKDLTAVFEALGHNPETAAHYGKSENAREMVVRSAFLHMLWSLVIRDDHYRDGEPAWITSWLGRSRREKEAPVGVAAAVARVLDKGVDPEDLTDIVRAEQWEIIYNVCQLLDGEWLRDLRSDIPDLPEFSWRLFEVSVDENYQAHPERALEDLHSQLGEVDPSGRDGEPRQR